MDGKHLLDTNIIIALFKNDLYVRNQMTASPNDGVTKGRRHQMKASPEVFVPAIAIGELYFGAQHSAHVEKNMNQVREFSENTTVLACELATAEHYGQIKNELKSKGHPLPENDVWIAAIAKQHSLTVVTRDQHFKEIDALLLEEW